MEIIILCSEEQKTELSATLPGVEAVVTWAHSAASFTTYQHATAFIDLLFDNSAERIALLASLSSTATIIVNSVIYTAASIHPAFVRMAGWPTMLSAPIIEAAVAAEHGKGPAEEVFAVLGKTVQWVPDVVGFITPRVISTIINEAYFALADGVSSQDAIDTAMKLGTAYPYGPFEWGDRIGLQKISTLLQLLSKAQPRYTPSELLVQETDKAM